MNENEGYKSLNAKGLERLRKFGKSDADLAYIDKKFKYVGADGKTYNFANTDIAPSISSYMKQLDKSTKDATKGYCKMLRNCFPDDYYGSDNQGSNWMILEFGSIYPKELLDKSNTKTLAVPSFDKFCTYFKKSPYYTVTKIKEGESVKTVGEFSEQGLAALDVKYQQYLKDIWPEYWNGKVFDNRKPVTQDNIDTNLPKLCQYNYKEIIKDTDELPMEDPIGEAHYFAIFCGNDVDDVMNGTIDLTPYKQAVAKPMTIADVINLPPNILNIDLPNDLPAAENTIDKLIERIEKLTEPKGGFPALLKSTLLELSLPLVSGIVWTRVRPYIDLNNLNNIDPKQLSKEAAKQMLQNFKESTQQMIEDTTKEVRDTINEIVITSKGMWDNIISLPKTVSLMCNTAALPQTIPTTGGIPNPITVVLDVMNIIDSILALFPPIIQDMMKILTLCKKLMIPLDKIPFLSKVIDIIIKIITALKGKKDEAMSVAKIHKAINKAEIKRNKLNKRLEKLDKDNEKEKAEYDDISETIEKINENIAMLEDLCTCEQHTNTVQDNEEQVDFYKQLESISQQLDALNDIQIDEPISNIIISNNQLSQLHLGTLGAPTLPEPEEIPKPTPIIASPLQSTNVTPYCGKVFTNV